MSSSAEPRQPRRSTRIRKPKVTPGQDNVLTIEPTPGPSTSSTLHLTVGKKQRASKKEDANKKRSAAKVPKTRAPRKTKSKSKEVGGVERPPRATTANLQLPTPTPERSSRSPASEPAPGITTTDRKRQERLLDRTYEMVLENPKARDLLPMSVEELKRIKDFYTTFDETKSTEMARLLVEKESFVKENENLTGQIERMRDTFNWVMSDLQRYRREFDTSMQPPKTRRKSELPLSEWCRSLPWTLNAEEIQRVYQEKISEKRPRTSDNKKVVASLSNVVLPRHSDKATPTVRSRKRKCDEKDEERPGHPEMPLNHGSITSRNAVGTTGVNEPVRLPSHAKRARIDGSTQTSELDGCSVEKSDAGLTESTSSGDSRLPGASIECS